MSNNFPQAWQVCRAGIFCCNLPWSAFLSVSFLEVGFACWLYMIYSLTCWPLLAGLRAEGHGCGLVSMHPVHPPALVWRMQVRWTLSEVWDAASLMPGISILALAQVCAAYQACKSPVSHTLLCWVCGTDRRPSATKAITWVWH